jgi:hypothetical protein
VSTKRNALLDAAVQAFRDAERARFLAERKDADTTAMLHAFTTDPATTREDRHTWMAETQAILNEYEAKRAKAGIT